MTIRRGPRPEERFYTVRKDISEDTRLSWAARGVLIFLLGKPDNWEVSVAHLIRQTEGCSKPSGRDAVRGIIKELIDAGYMRAEPRRSDGGAFSGIDYVVSEIPDQSPPATVSPPETDFPAPAEPAPVAPATAEPEAAEPAPATPLQTNTDLQQELSSSTSTDSQQSPPPEKSPPYERIREVFWQWFDEAYLARYGTTFPRNAKTNSQVKQLIQRLGKEAPGVARFYVAQVNEPRVLMACHTLDFLLLNAEGYRTQWETGRTMTQTRARQIDGMQAHVSAADEAIAILRARRERKAAHDG